jgi:GNAT superfamily N-acetyltransferase
MRANEFLKESKIVEYEGIKLNVAVDGANVDIRALRPDGQQMGYVVFDRDGQTLTPDDLSVDEKYQGQGIAKVMYDYVKNLGFRIEASYDQTEAGKGFWQKHRGEERVWEDEVDEMALKQFTPMGDFNKPGPFKAVDKRLVQHQTNQLKTEKFFEQTPYDFRLFFSNIPGTGKYSETGPVNAQQLQQMFGPEYAKQILDGSEDAITVVFVGNSGADKVMITPWIMAHRFGHAIQAGARRNQGWSTWQEAEKHFFTTVNSLLADYYRKQSRSGGRQHQMQGDLTAEYNALFNALGTQRSSRTGQIKRPYEFLYEIFAQYLKTGEVTFNPLPQRIDYGRKAWGTSTKGMFAQPGAEDIQDMAEILARDMQYMFDDVLSSSVGQIFVM